VCHGITAFLVAMVAVAGCGGDGVSPLAEQMADDFVAIFGQSDVQLINECECFWAEDGFTSENACVRADFIGTVSPAFKRCLAQGFEGYTEFAGVIRCSAGVNRQLSACLSVAACTDQAFGGCYVQHDPDNCLSPCDGLVGSALSACNARVSQLQVVVVDCASR
jgi:hypothetical protein